MVGAAVRAVQLFMDSIDRRFNSLIKWLILCVLQGLLGAAAAGGEMAAADPKVIMNRIAKAKQRWGFVKVRNGTKSHCLSQLHHQLYSKLAYTSGLWLMLKFSKGFALACARRHLAPALQPAAPGTWLAAPGSPGRGAGGTWELACWWHLGTWASL